MHVALNIIIYKTQLKNNIVHFHNKFSFLSILHLKYDLLVLFFLFL